MSRYEVGFIERFFNADEARQVQIELSFMERKHIFQRNHIYYVAEGF